VEGGFVADGQPAIAGGDGAVALEAESISEFVKGRSSSS
jgi:hypothetical protein